MNISVQRPRAGTRGAAVIGAGLHWRRIGSGWRLFDGRRRCGDVVPDSRYPGMWRPTLSGGRLGDMANISWAKQAVLEAAVREQEWSARRDRATDPAKCPEKSGVFRASNPPTRLARRRAARVAATSDSGSTAGAGRS
jgi:hypothetical protein